MSADRPRVVVLGGTFDPVHLGHLALAREVASDLGADRVLLVLSARPPHKDESAFASADHRWQMLRLAAGEAPGDRDAVGVRLEPCDVELRRDGPSYTVDTLRALAEAERGADLVLVVGADAWKDVDTWSRPGELLELASVVVTSRPGGEDAQPRPEPPVAARAHARYDPGIGAWVHTSGHTLTGHRIRGVDVSATQVRRRLAEGLPVEHLTGPAVARYLSEHGLYRRLAGTNAPASAAGLAANAARAVRDGESDS